MDLSRALAGPQIGAERWPKPIGFGLNERVRHRPNRMRRKKVTSDWNADVSCVQEMSGPSFEKNGAPGAT